MRIFILSLLIISISGCQSTPTRKTSLEIQAIQAREFETTKKIAFNSVLSVFQDLGYIVGSADLATGFLTAKSPTSKGFVPFVGMQMKDTKATATVEELVPGKTRIRLNFVESSETSSGYGMKSSNDKPIENPQFYENAYSKIQEAIFIRTETE